jgi:uncharacterized membrane protein YedE/YeeE
MKQALVALLAGVLFGIGLSLSGMTDTRVVLGFLDLAGDWNPTLAFVMGGALLVTLPCFTIILRKQKPLLCDDYCLPTKTQIDLPLIAGSVIFGAGWGLYGYCPGPALASLASLNSEPFVFVLAMTGGIVLHRVLLRS